MRIPPDAIISTSKLVDYLLAPRPWDDKSKYLAQAGFDRRSPKILEQTIRKLADEKEAIEDGTNPYGTFFRVEGSMIGPNGQSLHVVLIWLQWKLDGTYHFVTLKPGERDDDQI
jgi:hypothetical protein